MKSDLQIEKKDSWRLFDQIAGTYDFANHLLSFGIDILWRKKLRSMIRRRPSMQAVDLATGTGDVAITIGEVKEIDFVRGLDLSKEMIAVGNDKIKNLGLEKRMHLEIGDGVEIPVEDESIDLITLSFGVRNFSDVEKSLRNMHRVLKPGGQVLIMEFGLPKNWLVRTGYLFYFRTILPLIGKLVSKHPFAYSYLNKSVETFPYGKDFTDLMEKAGLSDVRAVPLSFGIAYIYCAFKK